MSSVDVCREVVRDLDNIAKLQGYSDFAELAAKVNVKSVDDAIKLIKAILAYRECKKVLEADGRSI